jgi:hypothetical protein
VRAAGTVLVALLASASAEAEIAPDLVARFEALAADVERTPTDATTIATRASLLADWVDAVSLEGAEITLATWGLRGLAHAPAGADGAARAAEIDALVREFRLRHEEPQALGTLTAERTGPFEAGSHVTLRQTYTVGTRAVQAGGGFWIARHFQANYGAFQTDDPRADGWITIESDDPDARFVPVTIQANGPHGGFRAPAPALAFRVEGGDVDPGQRVTVTYGDTSGGGGGLMMADFSSERMPFPVYVDLDGSQHWFNLPLVPFVVTGAPIAAFHAFAPSVVEPGESFTVSVRAEDAYRNRATGPVPAFELLLNGEVVARRSARDAAIVAVEHRVAEPGVYWPSVRSRDGTVTGTGNPILVEADPARRIYWGDTHGHSGYAEGIGTVDAFMRFARDDARLDYVTHAEHDVALDRAEWELMRATVARYDAPGTFIPFLGYEWTMSATNGGHHNVLYRVTEGAEPISALEFPTLSRLYTGLRGRYAPKDVVVIPHAHNPGDYRYSDTALEPLVEIMSMHGTFDWFAEAYLSHGHEVGFVAASDDHLSHPGYAAPKNSGLAQPGGLGAVLAPARTRDALFDSLKAHRTYATSGERMILDFAVNGTGMGGRAPFATERRIEGRVIGTAPIESVTVVKNGEQLWQQRYALDGEPPSDAQTFLVSFESQSRPGEPRDMPRGWRHWIGTVAVSGARLVSAEPQSFHNAATQSFSMENGHVAFATHTRGDTSSIRLTLAAVEPTAAIEIAFEAARETGGAPPMFRPPALVPGGTARLGLADVAAGSLVHAAPFDGFADRIVLRRIAGEAHRDVRVDFVDSESPHQGDYYYLRVRQIDDAIAWSSPVWIGGYAHR